MDEDMFRIEPAPPAFLWLVDIMVEGHPVPFASYQINGLADVEQPPNTGCHQPIEKIRGTGISAAWFANGLRIIDIAKPHAPREVAYYVPDPSEGAKRPSSNDVFMDDCGLIYLLDRMGEMEIVERAPRFTRLRA